MNNLVRYDPVNGKLYNLKSDRQLIPDENGYLTVYDNTVKRKYKIKAMILAWELGNNKQLPSSHRVLARNLDPADLRLINLMAIDRKEYSKVMQAIRNLRKIKLTPHPEDQHSYILSYHEGRNYREVIHDVVVAKQRLLKLQLRFVKIISKYCVFD